MRNAPYTPATHECADFPGARFILAHPSTYMIHMIERIFKAYIEREHALHRSEFPEQRKSDNMSLQSRHTERNILPQDGSH